MLSWLAGLQLEQVLQYIRIFFRKRLPERFYAEAQSFPILKQYHRIFKFWILDFGYLNLIFQIETGLGGLPFR
ncbi:MULTISPECIES: hypothetical protein [Nostocales]|uniref:Uncharacterized protein n=2 Tax=Nostocales TaxID=1161 RepID=A0A8S9T3G4_9CYAN|nr:hypothetical protein [Tolypothrix bouteillei]KAF3886636.1 hypothetical protein DA73_0400014975 [Tolypothrix bouteillei VB521301]